MVIPETQLLLQGVRPRVSAALATDQIQEYPVSSTTSGRDGDLPTNGFDETNNNVGEVDGQYWLSGLDSYDWDETVNEWDSC